MKIFNSFVDDYRERGVEYLITSSYTAGEGIPEPDRNAQRIAFYATLNRDVQQLIEFRP
jgi:hypothetical protein